MRGANVAPGCIRLEHEAVERDEVQRGQVRVRLQRAAVDAAVQVQCQQCLQVLNRARKRVHDSVFEPRSVRLDDRQELAACVAIVQEQGQVQGTLRSSTREGRHALHKVEVLGEVSQLAGLVAVMQAIVVQTALADRHDHLAQAVGRNSMAVRVILRVTAMVSRSVRMSSASSIGSNIRGGGGSWSSGLRGSSSRVGPNPSHDAMQQRVKVLLLECFVSIPLFGSRRVHSDRRIE